MTAKIEAIREALNKERFSWGLAEHVEYDHYINGCDDCQREVIRKVLDAVKATDFEALAEVVRESAAWPVNTRTTVRDPNTGAYVELAQLPDFDTPPHPDGDSVGTHRHSREGNRVCTFAHYAT